MTEVRCEACKGTGRDCDVCKGWGTLEVGKKS